MYSDQSPQPNVPVDRVLVIEGGENPDEVIAMAQDIAAVSPDGGSGQLYWVVFADKPRVAESYSERALRSSIPAERLF